MPARSKDFRYEFANAFSLQVSENEVLVRFSISENPANVEDSTEIVGVVMTPRSAKILQIILSDSLDALEKNVGPIQFPAEKMEELSKAMKTVKLGLSNKVD